MIRIAICDDDAAFTTVEEELIQRLGQEQNIRIESEIFFDGAALLNKIRQGVYFDLIFLDIEMRGMNGIHAACGIRELEIPALIVFVSEHEQYLRELFAAEPFRFLSKPLDEEAFRAAFGAACHRIRRRAEYFSFAFNKTFVQLPLREICYFESRSRVVYIHTAGTNPVWPEKFYGKISEIERQLREGRGRFLRIHQSYLINFDYVRSVSHTNVVMADGTVLKISEDRQREVRCWLDN